MYTVYMEDKNKKVLRNIYYKKPYIYYRPLRPYEKAYTYWYIEMLKPKNERNLQVINKKYEFARR